METNTNTNNVKQWNTTAGPRQSKAVRKQLDSLWWLRNSTIEIYNDFQGQEQRSEVNNLFGSDPHPHVIELFVELGESFDWTMTRDNHKNIIEACAVAITKAREGLPIEDNTTTPEEDAERLAATKEATKKREAEQVKKTAETDQIAAELRDKYPHAIAGTDKRSGQARAAANIKKELSTTFPGVKFSVVSKGYSMGDSVNVSWELGPTHEEVYNLIKKYQYGTFDPMTDCSGYDSSAYGEAVERVLGRSKYVFANRDYSKAVEEIVGRALCVAQNVEYDGQGTKGLYGAGDPDHLYRHTSQTIHATSFPVGAVVTGVENNPEKHQRPYRVKYDTPTPSTGTDSPTDSPAKGDGYEIQKHYHTKRKFDFWLVVTAAHVGKSEFDTLRDSCKAAGGWYSRQWSMTPGGFGFTVEADAVVWAAETFGGTTPPDGGGDDHYEDDMPGQQHPPDAPTPNTHKAEKLRTLADKLTADIDNGRADRRRNTPKQNKQAIVAVCGAANAERAQTGLYALADLYEAGEAPVVLATMCSKKRTLEATRLKMSPNLGYYDYSETEEYADQSPEAVAFRALIDSHDTPEAKAERAKAKELAELEEKVRFNKIPGYFPTPSLIASRLVEYAQIPEDGRVLEPSAGSGRIADAIRDDSPDAVIECVEANPTLASLLRHKGYSTDFTDFTEYADIDGFDRVVMNPPFENSQDILHVRHAFDLLKPGGRVVAIMSPGPFFRQDKKATAFRDWFEDLDGYVAEELESGAFKESGTGVSAKIVVIEKGGE